MCQSQNKRGLIMVIVLMLMPVCVILGAIMLSNIISEKRFLRYERDKGQSFYLAETGLNAAYYSFAGSTFTGFTHEKDETETDPDAPGTPVTLNPLEVDDLIAARIPFTRVSGGPWDGWYEYTWTPSSGHPSLTNSDQNEAIRFRVSRTYDGTIIGSARPTAWEIVCVAQLGPTTKTHRLVGDLQGFTEFALFDAGDLNEFIRGQNQNIFGKVHANGDIFLKPSGTVLSVNTETDDGDPGFTTAGKFWYGVDATGRTNMGTVRLDNVGPITVADQWPVGLDSFDANWVTDALAMWGGTVADQTLGTAVKGVPPTKSFDPDGFYAQKADADGLCIKIVAGVTMVNDDPIGTGSLATVVTNKTFYNHAEKRTVQAVQVDVSALAASDYPNQLIYSEKPIVLVNAQNLPQKTSIVSQSGIYTVGDFNKELATQADWNKRNNPAAPGYDPNHTTKKSSALMTKDRIWHLSKNTTAMPPNSSSGFMPAANDPEEYTEDNEWVNRDTTMANNNVIEINAMLLDGAPLHDEIWNREVDADGKVVPKWGPTNPDPANQATSWDDFLENHGGSRVVKKRGTVAHLQNAEMPDAANFNQSDGEGTPLGQVAWYRRIAYNPPVRDYGYDLKLKTDPPPFAPFSANRSMWTRN